MVRYLICHHWLPRKQVQPIPDLSSLNLYGVLFQPLRLFIQLRGSCSLSYPHPPLKIWVILFSSIHRSWTRKTCGPTFSLQSVFMILAMTNLKNGQKFRSTRRFNHFTAFIYNIEIINWNFEIQYLIVLTICCVVFRKCLIS